jgi:hypothetical protein
MNYRVLLYEWSWLVKITEELYREYNIRPPFHFGRKIPYEMLVVITSLFLMSHSFALNVINNGHV